MAAGGAVFYWAAIRPLATISGTVAGPGFPSASAARDRLGVPHIEAQSIQDALWVQGYVTAQDRLWQMDLLRRLSAGELSEVFGPAMIDRDKESRTLGLHRIAAAADEHLPAADRRVFEAYASGVNAFMDSHRDNLPVEFHLLRYEPRHWDPRDSILVALYLYRTLTTSWRSDLMKRLLLERATLEQVNMLMPVRSGAEVAPGSNAWAVSGAQTATGKPLLANDPHLDYSIPSIWHTIHLKAPALNVIGVTVPGLPGVILGHNERIAWGVTNLGFDVQDLYLSPAAERVEQEIIHVKGAADVNYPVTFTSYGPVVAEVAGQKAALHWTAADASIWQYATLEIDQARDWPGFRRALERFPGPAQNWVYADVDGNIGYQAAGKLPIRAGFDGSLPVPGGGRFDWQGYIPFDQLPSAYNPESGLIVTANQNPFPPAYPYAVNGGFAAHYRSNRIRELLQKGQRLQPIDFLRIQTDVYSPFAHAFTLALLAAVERRHPSDPAVISVAAQLRAWDCQFRAEETIPVLMAITYNHFLGYLVEAAVHDRAGQYTSQMSTAFVERILATRPAGWTKDYDELLVRSLERGLHDVRGLPTASTANWGQYLETTLAHPVGHGIPFLRRWFDIGPFPQAGTTTTVKQTTTRMGPSMRMIVDLGNLDNSLHNITTGESGQPFSPHYKDQWQAYYDGRSFPMQFSKLEIVERLNFVRRADAPAN